MRYSEEAKYIKSICLNSNATLSDALKLLNKTGTRLIFVIEKNRLVGTLSDGDLRKIILKNMTLDLNVKEVMNKKYFYLNNKNGAKFQKDKIEKYVIVPVLNGKKQIVGIYTTLKDISIRKVTKNIALIVAGGRGIRMLPLTKNLPKALLNVKGKFMIEHVIENLVKSDFTEIFISVHFKGDRIATRIGDGGKYGAKINYIREFKPLGSGGSVYSFQKIVFDNLVLTNCDVLTELDFRNLMEFHTKNKSDITVASKITENQFDYGVLKVSANKIIDIEEKPTFRLLINSGIYVINKSALPKGKQKYIDITDFIKKAIYEKKKVLSYPFNDSWVDLGSLSEYYLINDK